MILNFKKRALEVGTDVSNEQRAIREMFTISCSLALHEQLVCVCGGADIGRCEHQIGSICRQPGFATASGQLRVVKHAYIYKILYHFVNNTSLISPLGYSQVSAARH